MTNPVGRPTDYSLELSDTICSRLAEGESMRSISRDESMPCMTTLFKWLRTIEEFTQQYEKSKVESHNAHYDDIIDIADNQVSQPLIDSDGEPVVIDGKTVMIADAVSVNHAKLRIDSRKWALSKLIPKKYGDRIHTEHSGAIDLQSKSDKELDDAIRVLQQEDEQAGED